MTIGAYITGVVVGIILAFFIVSRLDGIAYMRKSPDGRPFIEHKGKMYWVTDATEAGQ